MMKVVLTRSLRASAFEKKAMSLLPGFETIAFTSIAELCGWQSSYNVALDGEIIVSKARDPETYACRALQARGIMTGSAHFARAGEPVHMRMDIAWGAQRQLIEGSRDGLRWVKMEKPK